MNIEDMDKDALEALAKEAFGVDLDKRKSLDNLRAQVRELDGGGVGFAPDIAEERHGRNQPQRVSVRIIHSNAWVDGQKCRKGDTVTTDPESAAILEANDLGVIL